MASRYCVCGGRTDFTVKTPTFCSACGQPFVKAFAPTQVTAAPKATAQTPYTPVAARPAWREQPTDDLDSTAYDESEVAAYARELAASVSASDFFSVAEAPSAGRKLSDVLDKTKQVDIGVRENVITDSSQLPPIN